MAYCLHPKLSRGHLNNDYDVRCCECEYLIKGARIDNYEVIAFIGRGSFGDVYEVREPPPLGDTRTFALKILREGQLSDPLLFAREAKRIASLEHQNILPVLKFGKLENNRPYFIMERAQETLAQRFQKQYAFAEELIPFIDQISQALDYIHKRQYIHQDIKPVNLLLKGEHLFLADFGTAEYLGLNTHITLQIFTGTPQYMPLEQLQGKPRYESDQYALAVSIYQLLTGHVPFEYPRAEQVWVAIMSEKPALPQKWNPRVPVEVGVVLLRAMARDYKQRYPSVLAFAEAYKGAVNLALQRYLCQQCGRQNRTGAHGCSTCGTADDKRTCPYCDTGVRFGQRCCAHCGRLTTISDMEERGSFSGLSICNGRYVIKRVLKNNLETKVLVVVAEDNQINNGQQVVVKRWPCIDLVRDIAQYEKVSAPLTTLRHPLVPRILEQFAEGKCYYHVRTYFGGESLEERLQKLLRPLLEGEVTRYVNIILNILIALELQLPPDSYHYLNITPTDIILDSQRERVFLTGFRLPYRVTRKLSLNEAFSPYLPLGEGKHDHQTLMYSLAACAHYALSNSEPSFGTPFLPIRSLNDSVSPAFEAILSRALKKESVDRYQSYADMQRDLKGLLSN